MRLKSIAALSAFTAAVFLVAMRPALADTIRVHEGESIQAAVDRANPGDTILVGPGVFNESVLITKNDITLVGSGATDSGTVITPPIVPDGICSTEDFQNGLCIYGDAQHGEFVDGVVVRGFLIEDFNGFGIIGSLSSNHVIENNWARDNLIYGIACFVCTGGTYDSNTVSGSEEAGLYQGDSPDVASVATNNIAYDNGFGLFLRDSAGGSISGNIVHDNCVGMMFLDTGAPTQVGSYDAYGNNVFHNTKACPASEEGPALSGVGVMILGGDAISLYDNTVTNNHPGGDSALRGGVVVWDASLFGGALPTNNAIANNIIRGNRMWDIHWDETGTGNTFTDNDCRRSKPLGLC